MERLASDLCSQYPLPSPACPVGLRVVQGRPVPESPRGPGPAVVASLQLGLPVLILVRRCYSHSAPGICLQALGFCPGPQCLVTAHTDKHANL